MLQAKLILSLCLLSQILYCQKCFTYRGLIVDSSSNNGIEGVHIFSSENLKLGSISNSDDLFILTSPQKLKTLTFSHVNYKTYHHQLENRPKNELRIVLEPSVQNLEQITVTSLSATKVVLNAIKNLETNHFIEPVYYDFFVRVVNFSKDSTFHFLEEHSGYILQKKNHNSEFSLSKSRLGAFSKYGEKLYKTHRLISMSEMFTDNMGKYVEDYLHSRRYKHYEYRFDDDTKVMDRECYVINFITDDDTYYKKGTLYIDKEDYGILKKTLNSSDYKEITFRRYKGKYYLNSSYYKKTRGGYHEIRSTIYNLTDKPNNVDFINKGRLSPEFAKNVIGKFDEQLWDGQTFIPLPNWIREQIDTAR